MGSSDGPAKRIGGKSLFVGLIPLVLLVLLIAFLQLLYPSHPITRTVFEPPLLVFWLNTIFLFLAPCLVSYMAARSYLLAGSPAVLFLGCGTLALGTGSLLAGWLIGPAGPNVLVTVHNTAALLSAIFHTAGIAAEVLERPSEADPARRRRNMTGSYLGIIFFVALIAFAAVRGATPLFFQQGVGPTFLRQGVVVLAFLLFLISTASMMARFIQKGASFLYWYALALGLLTLGMRALYLQPEVGSPIGWVARAAQYLAGIYLVGAIFSARKDAATQGGTLGSALADVFRLSERKIERIFDSMTDCHYDLDRQWRFTSINSRALAHFDRRKEDFIGRTYWDALAVERDSGFEQHCKLALAEGVPAHFDLPSHALPGQWVEVHAYPTPDGLSVYFRDITERKKAEEALKEAHAQLERRVEERTAQLSRASEELRASLAEKEILIREVHHRVKNNLAAIVGLLELQQQGMNDSFATAALKDLQSRIKSMALVHERLYRSENLSRIDFDDYLKALISHLRTSFGLQSIIRCEVAAKGVEMTLDAAVPCGMIVNELVSNAFKHAFPRGTCSENPCDILVSMAGDAVSCTLTVADNGVGLPADFDWETTKSLGLRLVRMLGQHQLGGTLELDRTRGTRFTLTFSCKR